MCAYVRVVEEHRPELNPALLREAEEPFPTPRGCKPAALTARSPAIAARHVGGSRRLIQEHQPILVELGLCLEPRLASSPYVCTLLLSCVRRAFF